MRAERLHVPRLRQQLSCKLIRTWSWQPCLDHIEHVMLRRRRDHFLQLVVRLVVIATRACPLGAAKLAIARLR